ncbi:nuclear transport factor 2 family protein [Nostoc ellipsosporum NOK]|jgi:hypothetical protein|nr:nuclear transport factor 2 family protein [Nostoc ellipsosporum NOK]
MKKGIVLLMAMVIVMGATAQNKKADAVAAAAEKLRVAMIGADSAVLSSLADEQLSYGHSGGAVENKKEFVAKIISGRSDFVTIDISNQTVSVAGNTAIIRHHLEAATNDSGKPGTVKLNVLQVWYKAKGKWKLLARQAVKAS